MITDEHRGLALELSLTKLLQSHEQLQIIGMSATIGGEAQAFPKPSRMLSVH